MRSIKSPSWINRVLGLEAVPPPPHVFALEREELRYGCFHHSPQGWVFETSRRVELPDDLFGDGVLGAPIQDAATFWRILQDFVASLPGGTLVGGTPAEKIEKASLILPDSWLRLTFTESGELPSGRREREEVLRFKLKNLVPFRVEELRVSATEVTPYPDQEEPLRLLVGFAVDGLITQLEDAFQGVDIEIGQVTNATLALLSCLGDLIAEDELAALVLVERDAFTLSYIRGVEPLLYRYKAFGDGGGGAAAIDGATVRRDLRLTSNFVTKLFPDLPLSRVFLAAPFESEAQWLDFLADELGVTPEPLGWEHFSLARTQVEESWLVTGPLLGAATIEVT